LALQAGLIQQNQTLLQQAFDTERKQTAARIAELEARLAAADASNTKPTEQEKAWYETLDMPELTDEQKKQIEELYGDGYLQIPRVASSFYNSIGYVL